MEEEEEDSEEVSEVDGAEASGAIGMAAVVAMATTEEDTSAAIAKLLIIDLSNMWTVCSLDWQSFLLAAIENHQWIARENVCRLLSAEFKIFTHKNNNLLGLKSAFLCGILTLGSLMCAFSLVTHWPNLLN